MLASGCRRGLFQTEASEHGSSCNSNLLVPPCILWVATCGRTCGAAAAVFVADLNGGEGRRDYVWGPYPTWVANKQTGIKVPVVQAGWGSR